MFGMIVSIFSFYHSALAGSAVTEFWERVFFSAVVILSIRCASIQTYVICILVLVKNRLQIVRAKSDNINTI